MTTGIRRGEICALRWRDIDLDEEMIEIRRNFVLHKGLGVEKDTKTHQMRPIALDSETVALLRDYQERVRSRVTELGGALTGELYVFGGVKSLGHSAPYSSHAVSSRLPVVEYPSDNEGSVALFGTMYCDALWSRRRLRRGR
jgi:integrase